MVVNHTCKWSLTSLNLVKNFKCDDCQKEIQRSSPVTCMSTVIKALSGVYSRYFRCEICEKTFSKKSSFLVHRWKHYQKKTYICAKCNSRFFTQGGLIIHKATHDPIQINTDQLINFVNNQTSKSQNVLSKFLKVQSSKPNQLLVIPHNSDSHDDLVHICHNGLQDENKSNIFSLSTKLDDFKGKHVHQQDLNKHSENEVIVEQMSLNNWLMNQKCKETVTDKCLLQTKTDLFKEMNDNNCQNDDDQTTSAPSVGITESSQHNFKRHKEINKNKTKAKCKTVQCKRSHTRLKTKSTVKKETLQADKSLNRMITRSFVKKKVVPSYKKNISNKSIQHNTEKRNISKVKKSECTNIGEQKDKASRTRNFQRKPAKNKGLSKQNTENNKRITFNRTSKLFECDICQKLCSDSSKLKDHKRLHTGEKPFVCKICNKSFRMKACLKIHNRVHTGEKPYRCSTCSKEFKYHNTYNRHLVLHDMDSDKKIKCNICNKQFLSHEGLNDHSKKVYKCEICSQLFCSVSELNVHKHLNHVDQLSVSKSEEKYCQFCNKKYKSNYTFIVHIQKHARKGMPVKFPCFLCSETFDSYDLLRNHRKTHSQKREKCVTCPWTHCGKKLTSQTRLNLHLKRHNGETHYLCHRCGMRFTDCVFYLKHRRACYQRINTYDCNLCGKVLSGYTSLQRHLLSHSGEKPCQCEICGARFNNSSHLRRHKRIHIRKGEMAPFDDVGPQETTVSVDAELPLPEVTTTHHYPEYVSTPVDIETEHIVTYFIDEQNGNIISEQDQLQTELLCATANVSQELEQSNSLFDS